MYRSVETVDPLASFVGLVPRLVDGEIAIASLHGGEEPGRALLTDGAAIEFSVAGMASHPAMGRRGARALRISDFLSANEWRRRPLYQEARLRLRFEDDLGFDCEWMPGRIFSVCVVRDRRTFSEEDRMVFDLLAAHVPLLLRMFSGTGSAVATPSSGSSGNASGNSRRGDPFATKTGRGACLSTRESQVLTWLGEGKSNGELALILGISRGTVKRHLENIYAKLGVDGRLAAVTAARVRGEG